MSGTQVGTLIQAFMFMAIAVYMLLLATKKISPSRLSWDNPKVQAWHKKYRVLMWAAGVLLIAASIMQIVLLFQIA